MLHDAVQDVGLELLLLGSCGTFWRSLLAGNTTLEPRSQTPPLSLSPQTATRQQNKNTCIVVLLTSSSMSTMGVCLLAGVIQRFSIMRTLMKSKTYFLAGWLVSDVLEPTLQYSDWLRFMPESPVKALNSSMGDPTSSSNSVTCVTQGQLKLYRRN